MQIKHTPAPWHKSIHHQGMICVGVITNTVASIGYSNATNEANANLIAAAPELLEALEGVSTALNKLMESANLSDDDYTHYGEWVMEANNVIKKAKGE